MNHCKDKKKHKWEKQDNLIEECIVCGKKKRFGSFLKGRKHNKGKFGKLPDYLKKKEEVVKENDS